MRWLGVGVGVVGVGVGGGVWGCVIVNGVFFGWAGGGLGVEVVGLGVSLDDGGMTGLRSVVQCATRENGE